jgi:hypothetical protein
MRPVSRCFCALYHGTFIMQQCACTVVLMMPERWRAAGSVNLLCIEAQRCSLAGWLAGMLGDASRYATMRTSAAAVIAYVMNGDRRRTSCGKAVQPGYARSSSKQHKSLATACNVGKASSNCAGRAFDYHIVQVKTA